MNENTTWQTFWQTGSVRDYLSYAAARQSAATAAGQKEGDIAADAYYNSRAGNPPEKP